MKSICHIIAILSIVFFLVGNCVYSYDTINGIYEYKEVTETFALKSDHINYLTIEDEKGNIQTIETTDVHPFWVVTDQPDLERAARSVVDENGTVLYHENIGGVGGFWVEAKDLRVGDVFLGSDGKLSVLTGVTRVEQTGGINVFNFTVKGNSNYFILEKDYEYGQTCVLVHNGSCSNGYKHALEPKHVKAAAIEKGGGSIGNNPKTGLSWDHLTETRQAMKGAKNTIGTIKSKLSRPDLSPTERTNLAKELGELSKLLERAKRILGE